MYLIYFNRAKDDDFNENFSQIKKELRQGLENFDKSWVNYEKVSI